MSGDTQIKLSKCTCGRIVLHSICMCRDHKISFHIRGIFREMIQTNMPQKQTLNGACM